MKHLILCLCLLAVPLTGPVEAASRNRQTASVTSKAKRKAASARRPAARGRTVAARAKAAPKPEAEAAPARTVAAPRRLEDIHIEGEIPAPQVLFVTARDQRRFTRFHHDRYLKSSAPVGKATVLPSRVGLTSPPSTPAGAP